MNKYRSSSNPLVFLLLSLLLTAVLIVGCGSESGEEELHEEVFVTGETTLVISHDSVQFNPVNDPILIEDLFQVSPAPGSTLTLHVNTTSLEPVFSSDDGHTYADGVGPDLPEVREYLMSTGMVGSLLASAGPSEAIIFTDQGSYKLKLGVFSRWEVDEL